MRITLIFLITITLTQQKEIRLGKSNYFIVLPNDLKISEARGKEGQLGYNFIPRNKESDLFGFIEIKHGHPITGKDIFSAKVVNDSLYASFLGVQTMWVIKKFGSELVATTPEGNVSAYILAKDRKDIDRLIMVFSSLSER